jgi:hypothetical protein
VTATPNTLYKPNHKMVGVTLVGAKDPDGDPVTVTVTRVTQDELTRGRRDAALQSVSGLVLIRSERDVHGDGRVYAVTYKVTDPNGGICSGTVGVSVPRRYREAAVDSGQANNSLLP